MEKKQIYIKCGTEYKEMTKELLETCDLAAVIKKHWGERVENCADYTGMESAFLEKKNQKSAGQNEGTQLLQEKPAQMHPKDWAENADRN